MKKIDDGLHVGQVKTYGPYCIFKHDHTGVHEIGQHVSINGLAYLETARGRVHSEVITIVKDGYADLAKAFSALVLGDYKVP